MSELFGEWFYAIVVIIGALLAGLVIDGVIVWALRHESGSGHNIRRSLARALRWQPEVWSVLAALWITSPFEFLGPTAVANVNKAISALAVLSITVFVARLAGWLIRAYLGQDGVSAPSGTIFVNLARLVIWAIGITITLGVLGVKIGPLMASLGVVGLAVSLGLQDTLANFFSGLQITLSRQVQPGDYVRLGTGEEGTAADVTWRNTTLDSPSGDQIIVPNSLIAKALMVNYSAEDEEHTAVVPFTVAYGSDLELAKSVAQKVAVTVRDSQPNAIAEFEPTCRFTVFQPQGVQGSVTIRVIRYQDRLPVVDALVTSLHSELAAAGIGFGEGAARGL